MNKPKLPTLAQLLAMAEKKGWKLTKVIMPPAPKATEKPKQGKG